MEEKMKIIVLNGSPKGKLSITMRYINYIEKVFPHHELKIFDISQKLRTIEKDEKVFQEIINEVESSDGVLWAFPLYYCLVHSNYKRFIELIFERNVTDAFRDKYTAAISTSIHFYDHTAHNYINAICDDLNMKYVDFFSAEMRDLLKESGRNKLTLFAENFFKAIENNQPTSKNYIPIIYNNFDYHPGPPTDRIEVGDKKVVIVTDALADQNNLNAMIDRFKQSFSKDIEVVNLNELDIKGGCLGCTHCGFDNICVYQDKDEFINFFITKVKSADILIFAGAIKDRYLSSRWKLFFDRSFFNTHQPVLTGTQVGFIISGPLSQLPNVKEIFKAYVECQQGNLVDFITDEYRESSRIDDLLHNLARRLVEFSDKKYIKPSTFRGIGGMKVFRDDIWGKLRFIFQADHKFYKKHRLYDFPQKNYKVRIFNSIMMTITKIPFIRKKFTDRMKNGKIKPFQKVLKN